MNYTYFCVSLQGLPKTILRMQGRSKVLHLRVPTVAGKVELKFKQGDIVRTCDWKARAALENYRVPRVNIFNKPKGANEFTHVYHDHQLFEGIKVFCIVEATDNFQHEIG